MTNPYEELIEQVERSIQSLVRSNFARDAKRHRLEKMKLWLLVLILVSAWIIFFLLCARLDSALALQFLPIEVQAQPHYHIKNGVRYAL